MNWPSRAPRQLTLAVDPNIPLWCPGCQTCRSRVPGHPSVTPDVQQWPQSKTVQLNYSDHIADIIITAIIMSLATVDSIISQKIALFTHTDQLICM